MRTVASVAMPSCPSEPITRPEQIVARRIEMGAADLDDLAVHQHHLEAENVVGGDAVLEAVRAARVHADVAGERAGELARGVRGVEEVARLDGLADAEIGDADLDPGDAVDVVDLEHAVHARHADHHRVLGRQSPARQRGARAARHHLDVVLVAVGEHAGDLLGGARQHDRERHAPIGRQRVRLVGAAAVLVADHRGGADQPPQILHDRVAPRHDRGIGLRQGHMGHGSLSLLAGSRRLRACILPICQGAMVYRESVGTAIDRELLRWVAWKRDSGLLACLPAS